MANIRIIDLPVENSPSASDVIAIDGTSTRQTTLDKAVAAGRPLATQAEAEAGVETTHAMTPLTTAQAIAALGGAAFAPSAAGMPTGGSIGQVLSKTSAADYAATWSNAGAGDLLSVNNLSDVGNTATALTNLGGLSAALAASTYLTQANAAATYQPIGSYQPLASNLTSWGALTRAAGFDTFASGPSSANLKALVTDETGSGALVFGTSPTLVTPALGTPSALVLTNATGLPIAGGGTGASTAAGARLNLTTPVYVADRAALAALDATKDVVAIIRNEGGRNGTFAFSSSNLSALVTADTAQGIYVAPSSDTSGASGAWVRLDASSGEANVKWFGAAVDGVSDDTAAVQAALNFGLGVYFPAGTCLVSALTMTSTLAKRIFGDGKGISILAFTGGGLAVTLQGAAPNRFTIEHITIASKQLGGTGISVSRSGATIESNILFRSVEVFPYGGVHDGTYYWTAGIAIDGLRFVYFDNVFVWGGGMDLSTGAGVSITSATDNAQFGFGFNGLWVSSFDVGLNVAGWIEGIYGNVGEIWTCRKPIYINRAGVATQSCTVRLSDLHVNGSRDCITVVNASGVGLSNCQVLHGTLETGGVAQSGVGILLQDCAYSEVVGNVITSAQYANGAVSTIAIQIVNGLRISVSGGNTISRWRNAGVIISGTSDTVLVTGNQFSGEVANPMVNGVQVSAGTNIKIGDNQYVNVTNPIVDTPGTSEYPTIRAFTPTAIGSTSAGVGTYTAQVGRATIRDRQVFFTASLTWTAHTGTGNLQIALGNLPVALATVGAVFPVYVSDLTFAAQFEAFIAPVTNVITLRTVATGAAAANIPIDTAATVFISGSYFI